MFKNGLLVMLAVFSFAVVAKAENQVDNELKAKDAKGKTFSVIDGDVEKVYHLTAEQAAKLPNGDLSKATEEQKKQAQDLIDEVTKNKPAKEYAINKDKNAATSACDWYYPYGYNYNSYYYNPGYYNYNYNYYPSYSSYYYPRYYGGGGYYYYNGGYASVYNYRNYGYYYRGYGNRYYWGC